MDLLGIRENTASRPSLISSIWSLQVQTQQEPTSLELGSQQSLPPLPENVAESSSNENSNQLRHTKSLSELHMLFRDDEKGCRIQEAPSFVWRKENPQNNETKITKQQKERNITEWLQQLQFNDSQAMSTSVSPTLSSRIDQS
ncbi:unnamed protein product [Bursaphelenchus xylophilus]|uniref:(pine wood nematode) hypothetical protein n=1 Tax=Bursaphelenchus xylophilus TaxID=6326 RepID=A0A1I7SQB0_BURXY|nr:unnamed protein product [Bursaphelenchus xylophilus]CAG9109680.1 unnamed protein product [Bursaphelenchus xylophilus]